MTSVTKLTLINKLIPWVSQTEKEAGKPENRSNNLMDPVLALSQNQLDYIFITSFAINVWPLLNFCPPEQSRLIWISSVARESLWSVWLIKDPLVFVLGFVFANLCLFYCLKGWLAIAKLKPLSLFISLLLMLKKEFDNVKIEEWKVKVVLAKQ